VVIFFFLLAKQKEGIGKALSTLAPFFSLGERELALYVPGEGDDVGITYIVQ